MKQLLFIIMLFFIGCKNSDSQNENNYLIKSYYMPQAVFSFSIDDGIKDFNYKLKDIFDKYEYKYTLSIIAGSVYAIDHIIDYEGEGMSKDDVKYFFDEGYEIASHSWSHSLAYMPKEALIFRLTDETYKGYYINVLVHDEGDIKLQINNEHFNYSNMNLIDFINKVNDDLKSNNIDIEIKLFDEWAQKVPTKYLLNFEYILNYPSKKTISYFKRGYKIDDIKKDFCKSKEYLEEMIGTNVDVLVYPQGANCKSTRDIVQECGYKVARSVYDNNQISTTSWSWWKNYNGEFEYFYTAGVSQNTSFYDLKENDFYFIPQTGNFIEQLRNLQEQYETNQIDLLTFKNKLKSLINDIKQKHLWINILEHRGKGIHLDTFDVLLSVLKEDNEIVVLPIGEAYRLIKEIQND